jgi:spore maturation protein CgeB
MKIVIYGLSITSSWGNGHATTYRALCKALHGRGHRIVFVEKDVEWYRNNRDLPAPAYCEVRLYQDWVREATQLVALASDADAIVVGSYFYDAIVATQQLVHAGHGPLLFYDIDTPVTMSALRSAGHCPYLTADIIPHFATYLSFTGGPVLRELEERFGSPRAIPFYCSVDADAYATTPCRQQYSCDLSYLGTYAPDRQPKLMHLLNDAAGLLPEAGFIVAGPLYPPETDFHGNVRQITHLPPPEHPSFYSSSRFTLNLTRADMVTAGYSPSVRLFEASACGAAILSDSWTGLEEFLTPNEEILLPEDAAEVADIICNLSDQARQLMGQRARDRILSAHTSLHRARQFEEVVSSLR